MRVHTEVIAHFEKKNMMEIALLEMQNIQFIKKARYKV